MWEKRFLYVFLILSNASAIFFGGQQFCKGMPFICSVFGHTGPSDFGSKPSGDSKSLIEMFVSHFTNAVHSSEILTDVFKVDHVTPSKFVSYMYDHVKAEATKLGMESPDCIANTASQPIADYFKTLDPSVMLNVFANSAAKFLHSEGLLNPANVGHHANEYANALKEVTYKSAATDNQDWKLEALLAGFETFFKSMNLLVPGKGQTLASTFANEVKWAGMHSHRP